MTYNKRVLLTLTIQGDYTNKIDIIKRIENIPDNVMITVKYDVYTNITVVKTLYEQEVKKFTEE